MNWLKQLGALRSLHYRAKARNYPKVNIADVQLEKPRYGFRRIRPPLISQLVTDTMFPAGVIAAKYREAGKPVPMKFSGHSDDIARRNHAKFQEEIAEGLPHFRVGNKKVYLPKARVCLLRPNAKHTPYQAKFLVPRNFNKMDLRDYLWHVYGLRALNVTVQLLPAPFTRGPRDLARYRKPQFKKMTIDMAEPFVWPDVPAEAKQQGDNLREASMHFSKIVQAEGSDKNKPNDASGGMYNKPDLVDIFVSKNNKRVYGESMKKQRERAEAEDDRKAVAEFLANEAST